jgi:hypothetical protein
MILESQLNVPDIEMGFVVIKGEVGGIGGIGNNNKNNNSTEIENISVIEEIGINDNNTSNNNNNISNNNNNNNTSNNNNNNEIVEENHELLYEEPWTTERENLVLEWRDHLCDMSKLHEDAGYSIKKKHHRIGIATYLIPTIMTFLQIVFGEITKNASESVKQEYYTKFTITNGAMFLLSGILSKVYTEYDLGTLYTLHFQYAAKYYDLIIKIDSELSRSRKYRTSADTFITELRCQIDNLNQTSPSFE